MIRKKIKGELVKEKTRGETQNDLLDALDIQREELAKLGNRKEQVDALRSKVRLAQAAEKVLPAETTLNNAKASWDAILDTIKDLEEKRDKLSELAGKLKIMRKESETKIRRR